MGIHINSDNIQLNQILSTLHKQKDKIPENEIHKIISKVGKKLKDLDDHTKKGFTPLTQNLKIEVIQTLKGLHQELSVGKFQGDHIEKLKSEIVRVQASVESSPLHTEKKVIKPKIGLKISFFSDIDSPDHNTAISTALKGSIEHHQPFITTRSLLKGTEITDKNFNMLTSNLDIEKLLIDEHSQWEVFQQTDPLGEEFLVFLPKSVAPDKTGSEKLEALDFASDGTLKQISLLEVFQKGPKSKPNLESFFRLFTQTPKIDKIFFIAGHGGSESIAGLGDTNFRKFTDFLEVQKCKGLSITSCNSGGISSLIHIPEGVNPKSTPSYDEQEKERSYLTIVRSLGDFQTMADQPAEREIGLFQEEFASFFESTNPENIQHLREKIQNAEKDKSKVPNNLMQVYFPHAAGVPGGFRPLNEQGSGFPITFGILKQKELEAQNIKRFAKSETDQIVVKQKDFLEILPLVCNVNIKMKNSNPVLLSMVPGDSHHLLRKITLEHQSPEDFLESTITFHKSMVFMLIKDFF